MRAYNWEKAKTLIGAAQNLRRASMGMYEDWFWTAETVWEDGAYVKVLEQGLQLGGIEASTWATPSLHLEFIDGSEEMVECHDHGGVVEQTALQMMITSNGPLSGPCQEALPPLEREQ